MKPKVYLESSVSSYLTGRVNASLTVAANQQLTQEWWDKHRGKYDLYISLTVKDEIGAGDSEAARVRLQAIAGIPFVSYPEDVNSVVKALLSSRAVPAKAVEDALHIALAATNGIDYLLTWNCRHIANANTRRAIEAALRQMGYDCPIICTPLELLGENQ